MRTNEELQKLKNQFNELWHLNRSITGNGFRKSLEIVSRDMPLETLRFPSGTEVFDWTVPKEWNAFDAYLIDPNGRKFAEFKKCNLHLMSYSAPFRGRLPLSQLKEHLYSLPNLPDAIPYRTSYYKERWGFCISHKEYQNLIDGTYEVVVDTELKNGEVVIGEALLAGQSSQEILLSTYLCHPSMANNELSGPLALSSLFERISRWPNRRYTYRFVFSAETIGTICYLTRRGEHLKNQVVAGFQLTCLADRGNFTYKRSRQRNTLTDRAAEVFLRHAGPHTIIEFDPAEGSDERQYCSPGFNLPFGSLMRTRYNHFPEYHTSLDDESFISFEKLQESIDAYEKILISIEANNIYKRVNPFGEPQLGKRGLYPSLGTPDLELSIQAIMWVTGFADGAHDLFDIAARSGLPMELIIEAAIKLKDAKLLEVINPR